VRDTRYARAQQIVHEALDLPAHARAAWLDARCGDDVELRGEVEWLIVAADDTLSDDIPEAISQAAGALTENLRIDASAPGSYRLIERLGEGGMGVVWLAERNVGGTPQRVALKRLRAGSLTGHARFQEEQRILASLNHPNIAHLVDAGVDADGDPFLAMEYVEGERIDRWCDAKGLDLRARAALFIKVCAAVSYAHERLVIHRDLKPANLLVDATGEPKLLDFGIARLLDTDAMLATATQMMTPAYASPEQIEGKPLGTTSDVWSLGVMLYELLAGVRPFQHLDGDHARASAILSGVVAAPSRALRTDTQRDRRDTTPATERPGRIPADLDAIVLKALRREPEQRYVSVRELADDLRHFLAARPVNARRGRWSYHAQLFMRRNRWPLAAGFALLAIIIGFTWRTVLAEREARLQAEVAERTTEFLIDAFSLSDPTQAERHDFSAREVLDRGRDRIDEGLADQPHVRARLLEALGNAYRGINEGDAGAPLLEAAAQLNLTAAVDDPVAAARSLRAKAIGILASHGPTDEAEHAAQRAVDLFIEHVDEADPLLADGYGTFALTLNVSGKEHQAISAARQALALRQSGQADVSSIARGHAELCAVMSGAGEFAQALRYCRQAVELHVKAGTTRSNDYRDVLGKLRGVLYYAGDTEGGNAIFRERLELTEELFGEGSSALASERLAFVGPLADSGLFEEADALLSKGLPDILLHHGAHSTHYARALFSSGLLACELGDFDTAEQQLRQAHDLYTRAIGERGSHELQVIRVVLATARIAAGRSDAETRALLESVIAARSNTDMPEAPLAYARLPLAHWYVINDAHDQAEKLLDQVEAVGTRVELELHARAAATRAQILRAREDVIGALRQDQVAFDITRRDRGDTHPRTARYALTYAWALRAAGEVAQAKRLEQQYRPILDAAYPSTSAFRRLLQPPSEGSAGLP